ncbi:MULTISPECIES: 3-keto-disaccharide hydrolase [Olivibacter]|jgi:hypothetical protein|uniref:3-keto-alpha-glucoside-1,2-lyase/3-keto-2-hydroxy-glucal hydratase domain-containing protein n=3 Tax=Sphingobacteriaceae TaxID=84566 RepID=F4C4L0_SPHS2|nr:MULTISPECIES: DUF1080 domain-containing protein [Olivibacter]MCL4642041.1 DUF1080 domain-containing protein [Olivibacter sp. UJ_SKK_5.1]MDM8173297.1 DUF1080 domain-containing protein [Olivibacter sp. 47]MDX3915260.1 DUF1080 domain-containing protein [Pseudosphingobacterium sp.]QEL03076.1 DUF1080 domain-containing protein [Olivibacter sp. LS-1]
MKKKLFLGLACGLLFAAIEPFCAQAQVAPIHSNAVQGGELIGRWDITVEENGKPAPSWLEVELSGFKTLVGRFVSTGGSARPVAKVNFENGKFSFAIPPQWEREDRDLVLEGTVSGDRIQGTITTSAGVKQSFTGVRAPYLTRTAEPVWGKPIELFNGKDLTGWTALGNKNQWVVKDGILTSPESGANLVSEKKFNDFKLHVEFRYKEGSNSGVYLRGRYEVQIIDNPKTDHPNSHLFGGVYGFLVPSEMAVKGPGEWQSYDITLVGRMVTIVANGKTIIANQEIPGITGGALDSNEGEPGPIYFQGDHGPIEFRKVVITPAK